MTLSTRVQPIDEDLAVMLNADLSDAARSATLASVARAALADGEEQNRQVLGRIVPHQTIVDGAAGLSEDRVRPDGVIVYEFELIADLFTWIADQLRIHAPVLTGRFRDSFTLYADGIETLAGEVLPNATEYVFLNRQPYARKIERGESRQAPDGVFEAVAALAAARFGNLARIEFTFRTPIDGVLATGKRGDRSDDRTPAIVITLRS